MISDVLSILVFSYIKRVQVLTVIPEMRECIYGCAISRLIDYDWFVNDIVATKWDIGQLQSQHSTYVDNILQV